MWYVIINIFVSTVTVCSGQQAHLSVAAVWSSSASGSSSGSGSGGDTAAAGGGGVTYVPGYERVRELEQ